MPLPRKFMNFSSQNGAFRVCCFKDSCSTVEIKIVAALGPLQVNITATCGIQKFR